MQSKEETIEEEKGKKIELERHQITEGEERKIEIEFGG